ncbi:MAG: 5-formyltetrahydrofolate cyclo-ligase [Propioniciclava sp.]
MPDNPWATTPRASQNHDRLSATKDGLRAQVKAARARQEPSAERDAHRGQHLIECAAGHSRIACYVSVGDEPDTRALLTAWWDRGYRLLLPVLAGHRAPAWAWCGGADELKPGFRGIPEPSGTTLDATALASVSMIIVPALLGTITGRRLGTGGGWYDRALQHRSPRTPIIAVLNAREIVDHLPHEPWDVPVSHFITELGLMTTTAASR